MKILHAAQISAKILDARDAMRGLFGDRYAEKVADWKEYIQLAMKSRQCNAIQAILHVQEVLERDGRKMEGIELAMLLSAAADVAENL